MKILVIGNGGREAAILRELGFSNKTNSLYSYPTNEAFGNQVQSLTLNSSHDQKISQKDKVFFETSDQKEFINKDSAKETLGQENLEQKKYTNASKQIFENKKNLSALEEQKLLIKRIKEEEINLVIVGPEKPLVEGISDRLHELGIKVFGPSQKGALLEGSKLFCKKILMSAKVPTADFFEVTSHKDLLEKSKKFKAPWVVKADALASGKGVYICKNEDELEEASRELFIQKKLGETKVFLEDHVEGKELSYMILTNGKDYEPLPMAQDHKRIFDEDKGPNTGGMGAVAPLKISEDLQGKIKSKVVEPFLKEIQKQNIDYRGVMYFGLMVKDNEPYVLEINTRFGDPEAQVILPLLDGDWAKVFSDVAEGKINPLKWKRLYTSCVVMAAPGYPDQVERGIFINGNIFSEEKEAYYLCAGVEQNAHSQWITRGGRVLNSVGIAETAKRSLDLAYGLTTKVEWRGLQKRMDIGKKVIKNNEFVF